tara:strand:+ start:129 stop:398 length:270 start_codon:yes stop_codon:yes gene_type:complete
MPKKKSILNSLIRGLYFFTGFSIGIILIWPGILNFEKRKCFFKIIKDGSDGKVSLATILSIEPSSLLKIKNAKNKYSKILLIGDQCFRE